jgi:predicted transcriptional regulator YdeE
VEPVPAAPLPEGYERLEVGAGQCAVFPCEGPAREAVEEKWHFIYNKWFPKAKYGYDSAFVSVKVGQ